ncbi:MAG: BamA/TamA family outer membrane protein [Chitinophagaceae bacterium]|nr:BamA/TamA family outer membrane protein [Chitinophagaceae bacterium]
MMARLILYTLIIGALLTGSSCNITKSIPANDALYTGASVNVESDSLAKKKKRAIKTQLSILTRPRPNSRFLGIPFKLYFYNIGGLFKKWGEPPVLLSTLNLENNAKILQNTLENTGYFHATVTGDTVVSNKKARAVYTARPRPQYTINVVAFEQDSSDLQKAINRVRQRSLLKPGAPFDLAVIKAERTRIDASLKNRGFFYFAPEYLLVDTDSTIGGNKVNLYVNTKKETPPEARKIYRINKVFIYSNYSLNDLTADTNSAHARFFSGYYVVDSSKFYNPRLFAQAMQFDPGEIYNRRQHNVTLNRLINLGIFKFVKNRFEPIGDTSLDAYYYLTPLPKKSLRAEIGGVTKSNNLTGTQISLGFTNRNTFRGGEILSVDAYVGSEVQYSSQFRGYNTFRIGAEANLAFPRFITPFFTVNPEGGFVPRTNMQFGYDIVTRQKLYTLNSYRAALGYIWKESIQKEHTLYPISIQYVQPTKVTQIYLDSLAKNPTLGKAIDTQFILGGNYNYLYNSLVRRGQGDGIYFNGLLDLSGNVAGLFTKGTVKKGGKEGRVFGAPFSQYVKVETDFRVYTKISESNIWANRIIIGVGIPHGNSLELPFIKQFFVGGNNSLRAFRSRSVGPGTYLPLNFGSNGFVPDQSGDIKLELNSELRFKIINMVFGAVFVDAGNVWLFNENQYKPGGKFNGKFLSELAVGTGLGIRFDINILVLRLDVGFPLKKPFLAEKNRWVFSQIELLNPNWRKNNLVYNLAIGYPF